MGLHPKTLYKGRKSERKKAKMKRDKEILISIKRLIENRSTYGYKRITALYNTERQKSGLPGYNKKRIYRIMRENTLLLPKSEKTRDERKKTGRIITPKSNMRWCSDCFEIVCFNGEKVYVSFVLDCCDREIISYVSHSRPLLSDDIQSLMIMAVERRFGVLHTGREIEFLSDRGSIYRSYAVQLLARRIGLKSCFTRAYSPESNGMSEAFVKTIKRDYVYVSDCYSAEVTQKLLEGWVKDYNIVAPHSGLGMRSPVGYRKMKEEKEICEVCPPLGGMRAGARTSQMQKQDVLQAQSQ